MIHKKLENKITDPEAVSENVIKVHINLLQHRPSIFGVYMALQ